MQIQLSDVLSYIEVMDIDDRLYIRRYIDCLNRDDLKKDRVETKVQNDTPPELK